MKGAGDSDRLKYIQFPFKVMTYLEFLKTKIELNTDYFRDGIGYLKEVERDKETQTLFDFMEEVKRGV